MWEYIYNLFRRKQSNETPLFDAMVQELKCILGEIKEIKLQLHYDKQTLESELTKRESIINCIIENSPDMLWFKGTDGKYVYANKAIRDNLLLNEYPIGKTDIELAKEAKRIWGDREHTFGEMCGNSDKDVLEHSYVGKEYVEHGKVKGKTLHLAVNKSIVKLDNEVIGVVGSGRDITTYRESLIKSGQEDVVKVNEFENKDK